MLEDRYIEVSKWMSNSLRKLDLKTGGGCECKEEEEELYACFVFPLPSTATYGNSCIF